MLRVLCLGAGVQSTTVALMAAHGEIPPIDVAIFADTQSEPAAVYRHLERLRAPGVLPFPVVVVTKGSLRQEIIDAGIGKRGAWGRPPLFIVNPDGSDGMTRRQCTEDYKLRPILAEVRRRAGIRRRSPGPRTIVVEQVFGISLDEAHRQRDGFYRWIRNVYPLVERRLTRAQCVDKLAAWGWTDVPKSACTFCPYHSDRMWADMKQDDPVSFADAVAVDHALRAGRMYQLRGQPYIHRDRIPLEDVDLEAKVAGARAQLNLFGDECAGVCGV